MTAAEAREYIAIFRKHIMPGTDWVQTTIKIIHLDKMTDHEALWVSAEFKRMEIEAAALTTQKTVN